MLKDKKSDERISAQEYNQLVTKILEILKSQKYLITTINDEEIRDRETPTTKVSDRKKQTLENIRRSMKFVDEEQEKIEWAKITYKTKLSGFITKSIAEISFEDSKATAVIHNVTKKYQLVYENIVEFLILLVTSKMSISYKESFLKNHLNLIEVKTIYIVTFLIMLIETKLRFMQCKKTYEIC
uniref:Uncharacterized protein n=1 Tax=Mycoplasma feriruminatoris TaxID=1179777 RepID=A0A654IA04_9MOLU|nr:hypothetical protein MF5292_00123 [Mycoplasma feriruminatoris]